MMLAWPAKAWAWLALRVLLAVALVLVLAGHFSSAAVTALKPALAWGLTQAAPDFQILSFQLGKDRNQNVLGVVVRQQRTLFLGGRAVVPEAHSIGATGATVGTVLQPLMVALVLLLAWPSRHWLEWPLRCMLAMPLLALVLMLDTPLSMAAWLWFAQVQQHEPGAMSPLLWWNTFLGAGGRLVLGLVAAGLALTLAQRAAQRWARVMAVRTIRSTAQTTAQGTVQGVTSPNLSSDPETSARADGQVGDRPRGHGPSLSLGAMVVVIAHGLAPASAWAAAPVPDLMLQSVSRGEAVDVIVEVDVTAAERDAAVRRRVLPRGLDDAASSARLALAFAERKDQVLNGLRRADLQVLRDYSHLPQRLYRVRSAAALGALAALPGVRALHAQQVHQAVLAESLPWVGQPTAALAGLQGNGTTVAVIDDGIDLNNPAFGGCTAPGVPASCKVVANPVFVSGATPNANSAHGSNVAAVVLGTAALAKVAAINVFRSTGGALTSDILSGINWAIANRAAFNIVAINMSLGDSSRNASACAGSAYATPVTTARNAGIQVVAAAGNAGYSNGTFLAGLASPACTPGVLSVGAVYDAAVGGLIWSSGLPAQCTDFTTGADQVACFSMSANYLSLLAPGALILAGGFSLGGTSQAAPHVAGALAVLRAAYANEALSTVEARLQTGGVAVLDGRTGLTHRRLSLATSARPANDDWSAASTATGSSGSLTGSNRLATLQAGEPTHTNGAAQSVWWRWTAPASGQVTVDTAGSSFDTGLHVYTGAAVNALTAVAANNNQNGGLLTSQLRFQSQSGTTYHWAVTGVGASTGSVTLNWGLNTAARADLALVVTGPGTVAANATALINVVASNAGPQSATLVVVALAVPTGLTVANLPAGCTATAGLVSCALEELAAGAQANWSLSLINTGLVAPVNLSVSIVSAVPDPVSANSVASLSLSPSNEPEDLGDIPTLPGWALMSLGAGLLWRMRQR